MGAAIGVTWLVLVFFFFVPTVVDSGLAASRRPGMTGREFPFNPQR
jgi:hypothetical protein